MGHEWNVRRSFQTHPFAEAVKKYPCLEEMNFSFSLFKTKEAVLKISPPFKRSKYFEITVGQHYRLKKWIQLNLRFGLLNRFFVQNCKTIPFIRKLCILVIGDLWWNMFFLSCIWEFDQWSKLQWVVVKMACTINFSKLFCICYLSSNPFS